MPGISKKEADAYDSILEAAAELAELIRPSGIRMAEDELEELTIFLARHAPEVRRILQPVARRLP